MGPKFKKMLSILAIASTLSVGCKLFLIEIRFRDDPSIGLAIKSSPSLSSYLYIGEADEVMSIVLLDETTYAGEEFYAFMAGGGWLIFPVLFLFVCFVLFWSCLVTSIRR